MTILRRLLELVLVIYVVGVVGFAVVANLAPAAGYGFYAVRSASMVPALRVGDLVVVEHVPAEVIRPGDVVTIATGNGALVTHRVVAAEPTDAGPVLTLKGDANGQADPVAVQAAQLQGRLTTSIAFLGFVLALLSMPIGIAGLFSIGASLMAILWLLDGPADDDDDEELQALLRVLSTDELEAPLARRAPWPSPAP